MPRLLAAAGGRLRVLNRRIYRRFRLDLWFPHIPLALAVGGAGVFALLLPIRRFFFKYLHLNLNKMVEALHPIAGHMPKLVLIGVPTAIVGILQIIIALGLLARSRLAWLSALLITIAQLALAIDHTTGSLFTGQIVYVILLLVALLLARDTFRRSSLAAGTLFAVASVILLLVYAVLGSLLLGPGFSPPITTMPDALYFSIVTMSTVGYGDIDPKTPEARLFVVSVIILGLTIFATALTAVIGPLVQNRINQSLGPRKPKMKRVNHYIITGKGPLAHNTVRELRARDESVIVILEEENSSFGDAEIVIGDPTELEALRTAGAEHAQAVLALSDDDSENAFVILALRELGTEAKKVAAVSSRKNLERVRRVYPDMILAPSVFGGEVLAMALTEERIDGDELLKRFLDVKPASAANGGDAT
ncbi:MAG TPA: voltage-gated potassium channel protein [Acetobacteraceae bacterium]|nr:voltage-gated potassium channel protein [Acetobacteraceae bacterium]